MRKRNCHLRSHELIGDEWSDLLNWTQQEQETLAPPPIGIRVVRNVTQPTLTAYLPDGSTAARAAVIICPGGAFHFLAIEHEGTEVARWLMR